MFTDLTPTRLEAELTERGTPASDDTIRDWLDSQGLRLRKIRKVKAGGESPDRDTQFQDIAQLIEQYLAYPAATSIRLLFDCGGSNSANKYLFKHDLQALVDAIGIEIRVAHYPSYCSKYNPIERRFFPHVTRACTGLLFDTLQRAVDLTTEQASRSPLQLSDALPKTRRDRHRVSKGAWNGF